MILDGIVLLLWKLIQKVIYIVPKYLLWSVIFKTLYFTYYWASFSKNEIHDI